MAAPPELQAFCDREYDRIVGSLALYCGDRDVAVELAQETLFRVSRDWHKVAGMQAPGAWAHRVAMNLANSHYRRRSAERRAVGRHRSRQTESVHRDADAADAVVVRRAVAALPRRQRSAVVLRYYLDYPLRDIAAALEISEGAVKSLLHRATTTLRAALGDDSDLPLGDEEASHVR